MKTIVLDTEYNGMRPEQLCQLSYIIADNGRLSGRNYFFSVSCMNEYSQKKHGFSKKRLYDLSGGKVFSDHIDEISNDLMDADLICGHNIASDTRLLKLSFSNVEVPYPNIQEFCTMKHFDNAMQLRDKHGRQKPPRLDELCEYLNISDEQIREFCVEMFGKSAYRAHDARFDASATYLCIQAGQSRGDLKGVI